MLQIHNLTVFGLHKVGLQLELMAVLPSRVVEELNLGTSEIHRRKEGDQTLWEEVDEVVDVAEAGTGKEVAGSSWEELRESQRLCSRGRPRPSDVGSMN